MPSLSYQSALPKTCPSVVQENITESRNRSKVQYDKKAVTPLREFTEGEKVYLKPRPTNRSQPWIHAHTKILRGQNSNGARSP